jgi:hypothetical protein
MPRVFRAPTVSWPQVFSIAKDWCFLYLVPSVPQTHHVLRRIHAQQLSCCHVALKEPCIPARCTTARLAWAVPTSSGLLATLQDLNLLFTSHASPQGAQPPGSPGQCLRPVASSPHCRTSKRSSRAMQPRKAHNRQGRPGQCLCTIGLFLLHGRLRN